MTIAAAIERSPTHLEAEAAPTGPRPRTWDRDEFARMAEIGLFEGQRAELIEGEIVVDSPQGAPHSSRLGSAYVTLHNSGWAGVWFRMQLPLALGPRSEPEPDISVVIGSPRDYRTAHPTTALLVIEVADSSAAFDRTRKASLYAAHGVPDYWMLDVIGGKLEVRRDPRPDPSQPSGHAYASVQVLGPGDAIAPVAAPEIRLAVADLLGEDEPPRPAQ